jgi:Ser/Thr protein kinase RdoA (MazF antagonist)
MVSGRVVHTTLSSRAVADFATEFFDFASPPTARLQNRGFNDVYELVGPPRYFLRIGREGRRRLVDADTEAKVLVQARAAGAPVAVAERGRNGRFAQRLVTPEGVRAVLLFRAAPGQDAQETPAHACAQGVALAQIHAVALDMKMTSRMRRLDVEGLIGVPTNRALAELCERPALASQLERVAEGTMRHIELLQAELTLGFCHGDFHGYNAAIEGSTATVFDFDEGGFGWIAYDLATFLWARLMSESRRPMWWHFVAGYRSRGELTQANWKALEALLVTRELWSIGAWAEGAAHWGRQWFGSSGIEERIALLARRFDSMSGRLV